MSPILIFFGDMFFINMLNKFFIFSLFLLLLYIDKMWPEITEHVWVFVAANLAINMFTIVAIGIFTKAGDNVTIPLLLMTMFTVSSMIPVIIFAFSEIMLEKQKSAKLIIISILTAVLILISQIMIAGALQM